jgi:predicted RNA-binding protein
MLEMARRWSEEEKTFLSENCNKMLREELASHLERSVISIYVKALEMELTTFTRKNRRWTKKEIAKLYRIVEYMSLKKMAKALKRSEKSISRKLNELGIKCSDGKLSMVELGKIFGVTDQGIAYRRNKLGLTFRTFKDKSGPTDEEIVLLAKDILKNPGPGNHAWPARKIKEIIKDYGG